MKTNRLTVKPFFYASDWWIGVLPLSRDTVHKCNHFGSGPGHCAEATVRSFVLGVLPMVQLRIAWRGRWRPVPPKPAFKLTIDASAAQASLSDLLSSGSYVVAPFPMEPIRKRTNEPGVN
ncbi:MAG TPA: hypothetical protein VGN72_05095 [Tepidisphaeraceae bacterium]|nr:hypothetical protein [Tepidisphaeraceae bacterium]